MRHALTWFLTNWHWFAGVLALAVILVIVGAVLALRADEGDPSEVARFDAYLDDVEAAASLVDMPGWQYEASDGRVLPLGTAYLPGPVQATARRGKNADDLRAGELHYMDTWLGRPGDGSEHTALRVRREGEAMLARVEAARRELAAECGIRYVPMELVAA